MRTFNKVFAAAALATLAFAVVPSWADDEQSNFVTKMAEQSPDGKVTKADVMKKVEKMFDKHDSRKEGKLDKKQADAFYRDLMNRSPGG
jgi:hypothetical protein